MQDLNIFVLSPGVLDTIYLYTVPPKDSEVFIQERENVWPRTKSVARRAMISGVLHECTCSHISGMQSDRHKVES